MRSCHKVAISMLVVALLAVPGIVCVTTTTAAGSPLSEPAAPQVLLAGQTLSNSSPYRTLKNGEFILVVDGRWLLMYQNLALPGPRGNEWVLTTSWSLRARPPGRSGQTALTMRRNGNLVLTNSQGTRLWSTHTAGTGTGNRLVLSARGNLTVVTGKGKVVWSSHSGPAYLGAGGTLASGQRMIDANNEYKAGAVPQTLTMQPNGNLVRRCGKHVLWQSRTHIHGSRMLLRDDGDLLISSPAGRTVWSSHSGGHSRYVYLDMSHMRIQQVIPRDKILWERDWKRSC